MINLHDDISKLIEKDVEHSSSKDAKKCVTFHITTCAQLDKSVDEAVVTGDDTLSLNDLVIDKTKTDEIVGDVVTQIIDTVGSQENEAVESGVPVDECPSDELSCTPPCSQIPRRDPYAKQRFIFFNTYLCIFYIYTF